MALPRSRTRVSLAAFSFFLVFACLTALCFSATGYVSRRGIRASGGSGVLPKSDGGVDSVSHKVVLAPGQSGPFKLAPESAKRPIAWLPDFTHTTNGIFEWAADAVSGAAATPHVVRWRQLHPSRPRALYIENMLTPAEAAALIKTVAGRVKRSKVNEAESGAVSMEVTVATFHPLPPSVFDELANAFEARGILMFMVWVGYDASGVTKVEKLGTKSQPPTLDQTRRWQKIPQLSLTLPYAFATYTNAPGQVGTPFRVALELDQNGAPTAGNSALVDELHLVCIPQTDS